jgi:hypothetical protein
MGKTGYGGPLHWSWGGHYIAMRQNQTMHWLYGEQIVDACANAGTVGFSTFWLPECEPGSVLTIRL